MVKLEKVEPQAELVGERLPLESVCVNEMSSMTQPI